MKEERKESESSEPDASGVINDDNNVEQEPDDDHQPVVDDHDTLDSKASKKRAWEQWLTEDKAIFFEALNESGKNFDAIQSYFQSQSSKRRTSGLKNKDQIRTFYYRTWHKICKHVDFPENLQLKKSARELYGLINFGELRKRLGSQLDDKTGVKLRELIFKGHTTVRVKGKAYRLRTPTCPALKKLANSDPLKVTKEESVTVAVPTKLTLALTPATFADFDRVLQKAMTNPRLNLSLNPNKSLSSVIEYLNSKWRPADDVRIKTLQNLVNSFSNSPMKKNPTNQELSGACSKDSMEQIWLLPKSGDKISKPVINVVNPTTSASLSLSNLQNKLDQDNDSTHMDKDHATKIETSEAKVVENEIEEESAEDKSPGEVNDADFDENGMDENPDEDFKEPAAADTNGDNFEGWNFDLAKSITVGELFLMLGSKDKTTLELQYTFKSGQEQQQLPEVKCDSDNSETTASTSVSSTMSALARLASFELNRKLAGKTSNSINTPMTVVNGHNGIKNGVSSGVSTSGVFVKDSPTSSSSSVSGLLSPVKCNGNGAVEDLDGLEPVSDVVVVEQQQQPQQAPEHEFRRPLNVAPLTKPTIQQQQQQQAFRQQLENLMPKYSMRKGRPHSRSKRPLLSNSRPQPIQPQPSIAGRDGKLKYRLLPANPGNMPGITMSHPVVTFQIQQQQQGQEQQQPPQVQQQQQNQELNFSGLIQKTDQPTSAAASIPSSTTTPTGSAPINLEIENNNSNDSINAALSFFDPSLNEAVASAVSSTVEGEGRKTDPILDSVLENSNSSVLQTPPRVRPTPPTSPSRALSNDSWLPDLSFGSFLGKTSFKI